MLYYYNVHVSKNRGTFHASQIYAYYPTTFFQLGVYCTEIATSELFRKADKVLGKVKQRGGSSRTVASTRCLVDCE